MSTLYSERVSSRPSARIEAEKKAREDEDARQEALRFFCSLEERTEELLKLAESISRKSAEISVSDYMDFRNLMSECLTFLIIVEKRLEKVQEPAKNELYDKHHDLTVAIWSILLKGSLEFLQGISAEEHLPIGSRDIFIQELRTLYEAEKIFHTTQYQARVGKDMQKKLEVAERILNEIIERAPSLLKLG